MARDIRAYAASAAPHLLAAVLPCAAGQPGPKQKTRMREARSEQRKQENNKERSKTASKSRKFSGGRASRAALRANS
jgi:hypothetical protein